MVKYLGSKEIIRRRKKKGKIYRGIDDAWHWA